MEKPSINHFKKISKWKIWSRYWNNISTSKSQCQNLQCFRNWNNWSQIRKNSWSSCIGHQNKRFNPLIRFIIENPFSKVPKNNNRIRRTCSLILFSVTNRRDRGGLDRQNCVDSKIRAPNSPSVERLHLLQHKIPQSLIPPSSADQSLTVIALKTAHKNRSSVVNWLGNNRHDKPIDNGYC